MDLMKQNAFLTKLSHLIQGKADKIVESDITLPDYFPDIVKVIRCCVTPNISKIFVSQNCVNAEGTSVLNILYLSEDGRLHCFEQKIPFSKSLDSAVDESYVYTAQGSCEYVNYRVVSPRRIDVHSNICIVFTAHYINSAEILTGSGDSSIQTRKQTVSAVNLKDYKTKLFTISETLEIGSSQPTINQIIKNETNVFTESLKVISGKILLKGRVITKITYLGENDSGLQRLENSVPFSQILEADVEENDTPFIKLCVSSADIFAKTDSAGTLRLVDFSCVVNSELSIYKKEEISVVADAYSTKYLLNTEKRDYDICSDSEIFNEIFTSQAKAEIKEYQIKSVIDISAENLSADYRISDGQINFTGSTTVSVIAESESDGIVYIEKPVEFEFVKTSGDYSENAICDFSVNISAIGYTLNSENEIDIRTEYDVNALIIFNRHIYAVSNIDADANMKLKENSYLTVYFADKGEKLWDIAKKFNTSADEIKAENSLCEDEITEPRRLIITPV
ncbi:MAG: DUF3794 domain-containing protein [Ruminococcaceae bacterium]|nr:DUF3794 domain-containing protein [Oscillospiraceae bacterium]